VKAKKNKSMKVGELNFLEYIGTEEQNLLTSINNFRQEFDIFYNIDRLYQEPIKRLVVSKDNIIIPQLYLFVHFHLYFSMSCLLRSHLSECLASMRKAIDASLSAYKIILEPLFSEKYLDRDKYFQFIKGSLQREIGKDSSKYPLAHALITIHEACSQFGSHADDSSFFHRLETKEIPETNQDQIFLHYFQFPRNHEEYKFYYIVTLQAFYQMFLVFKLFLDKTLKIIDPKWENTISALGPELERLRKEAHSKIE
jgi:hypothetical protein